MAAGQCSFSSTQRRRRGAHAERCRELSFVRWERRNRQLEDDLSEIANEVVPLPSTRRDALPSSTYLPNHPQVTLTHDLPAILFLGPSKLLQDFSLAAHLAFDHIGLAKIHPGRASVCIEQDLR